jgi:hypothetical protein
MRNPAEFVKFVLAFIQKHGDVQDNARASQMLSDIADLEAERSAEEAPLTKEAPKSAAAQKAPPAPPKKGE